MGVARKPALQAEKGLNKYEFTPSMNEGSVLEWSRRKKL
jgi:hypothetical protein